MTKIAKALFAIALFVTVSLAALQLRAGPQIPPCYVACVPQGSKVCVSSSEACYCNNQYVTSCAVYYSGGCNCGPAIQ